MGITYIIAGSFNEYRLYIRDKQLDGIQYKWVSNVDSIRGLNDISGVFIGTWADRDDIVYIIGEICNIKTRFSDWDMPIEIAKVYNKKMREFYQKELQNAVSTVSNYTTIPYTPVTPVNSIVIGTTIKSIWMDEFANTDTSRSI